jgi:hypothetical protein
MVPRGKREQRALHTNVIVETHATIEMLTPI